ncbi:MAG: hypothetical protein PHS37_02180 [Candidatus Omnitrophica bacterium]|nr:hypothetical protein [Candidatus Omnitrophota bacterium]
MMKRLKWLALFLIAGFPQISFAEFSVQERRIEEEKRANLRHTEQVAAPKKEPAGETPEIDVSYFRELLSKRVIYIADACKVLAILTEADCRAGDARSQLLYFKDKKIFPKNILKDLEPDTPLRKGVAAYMFAAALHIKGGVVLTLFGLNQRYAMSELIYEGLLYPGDEHDIISGTELVLLFTGAADYCAATRPPKAAQTKDAR